jgi:hypothetical protein
MRAEAMRMASQALRRIMLATGIVMVDELTDWTDQYFGLVEGMCISILIFIITTQLNQSAVEPLLLKRVCLLYCNRQASRLFIGNDTSASGVFSNILLAMAIAVLAIVLYDSKDKSSAKDLQHLLDGLLFMYGDMMDFAFQYGVFMITMAAFGVSMFMQYTPPPTKRIPLFCWQLGTIISANLLSQGMTSLIPTIPDLRLLQCIASVCILRLLLPGMQSYLTYLAAKQLVLLIPGMAPLFFCVVVCIRLLPVGSQDWMNETCTTYILAEIAGFISRIHIWGMVLALILAHYVDYIITAMSG